jgi:hypothetical protein
MSSSVLLLQQRNGREYSSDEEKILTTHDSFIFLKNNWNRSDPIFTNVDVTSIKYYLDSYLNENVSEINENEILKSSDTRIILFIQTNKQNDTLEQILNISESHSMFIRCLKDEKYEVWVNKKFDNFCN